MYWTHNNHYEFGWNSKKFNFEEIDGEFWAGKYGRASYIPNSFREECVRAASLIADSTDKPIIVHTSGGIDSEIVCRSFVEAKVPFQISVMKYKWKTNNHHNWFDTQYAFDFAKKFNIKYHETTVDLENFVKNNYEKESDIWKSCKLGILIQTDVIKSYKNFHNVYGGGHVELNSYFNEQKQKMDLCIYESPLTVQAIYRAWENDTTVNNRFYMYTPELMLSWLLHPDVQHYIKHISALIGPSGTIFTQLSLKNWILYKLYPELTLRPKYTGFEQSQFSPNWIDEIGWNERTLERIKHLKIESECRKIVDRVCSKFPINSKKHSVKIDVEDLISQLLPN